MADARSSAPLTSAVWYLPDCELGVDPSPVPTSVGSPIRMRPRPSSRPPLPYKTTLDVSSVLLVCCSWLISRLCYTIDSTSSPAQPREHLVHRQAVKCLGMFTIVFPPDPKADPSGRRRAGTTVSRPNEPCTTSIPAKLPHPTRSAQLGQHLRHRSGHYPSRTLPAPISPALRYYSHRRSTPYPLFG